jgi:hypothetical protein
MSTVTQPQNVRFKQKLMKFTSVTEQKTVRYRAKNRALHSKKPCVTQHKNRALHSIKTIDYIHENSVFSCMRIGWFV